MDQCGLRLCWAKATRVEDIYHGGRVGRAQCPSAQLFHFWIWQRTDETSQDVGHVGCLQLKTRFSQRPGAAVPTTRVVPLAWLQLLCCRKRARKNRKPLNYCSREPTRARPTFPAAALKLVTWGCVFRVAKAAGAECRPVRLTGPHSLPHERLTVGSARNFECRARHRVGNQWVFAKISLSLCASHVRVMGQTRAHF